MEREHPELAAAGPAPAVGRKPRPQTAAASVLRLQRGAGNAAVAKLLRRASGAAGHEVPWRGKVSTRYNAALRRGPKKDPDDPYSNIAADVPQGTEVTVLGEDHGWLRVEVTLEGAKQTGYISHELIRYLGPVKPDAPEPFDPSKPLDLSALTPRHAFVVLKRAENRRLAIPDWKPTDAEQHDIDFAIDVLERNNYVVDHTTFAVDFGYSSNTSKIQIETIEDFILFVEAVERQYPDATTEQIAGELRQIWFGGPNWEALLNSPGVSVGGKAVDIEHEPDPIARRFDIPALKVKGHKLSTELGDVDISHVLAGIDAALNGAALEPSAADPDAHLRWKTLNKADAGDPRDFVTWSGDIGQAYAEYLVARYVDGRKSAKLQPFIDAKASPEQLLGDVHGYIAMKVWSSTPPSVRTSWFTVGLNATVSDVLRTLYLVDKTGSAGAGTNQSFFEQVSGKSGAGMQAFIVDRSLAFARPWYAKTAAASRGKVGTVWHGGSLDESTVLADLMKEFDDNHGDNERTAPAENRLGAVIGKLLPLLSGSVR
jgi:hypothetical protein